jgi:hypothetical protein
MIAIANAFRLAISLARVNGDFRVKRVGDDGDDRWVVFRSTLKADVKRIL